MNRWTDLLMSFGFALLLHGLLVLGAVWFWNLRPPELRPVFQSGDVSLAVTFVAAVDGGQPARRSLGEGGTTDPPSPERFGGQATVDNGSQKTEPTDILTDPETEMPDNGSQMADDSLPAEALAKAGRQTLLRPSASKGKTTDAAAELPFEEEEDQDMLDAEPVAAVSAQASANAPAAGSQNANQGSESSGAPSDALRQGVSGAVRMQSEIRPYYPLGARLRGEEGAVTVRVWVNPSGRARRCEVARSSGYPALDQAAVDAARRARYVSTRLGAWRAEAETTLTFRFRLTE